MANKVKKHLLCLLSFICVGLSALTASGQDRSEWVVVHEDEKANMNLSAVSTFSFSMPESNEMLEWLWLGDEGGLIRILLDTNENKPTFRDVRVEAFAGTRTQPARPSPPSNNQPSPSINDIYFRDPKTGFLLKGNLIFWTRSGGLDWSVYYQAERKGSAAATLNSIGFFPKNQAKACVVGSYSQGDDVTGSLIICKDEVYKDKQRPWLLPKFQSNAELLHLALVEDRFGWIVGDGGTILYTQDGGLTWTPQQSNTKVKLFHVDFHNQQVGWAVGQDNTILRTEDGGQKWELAKVNMQEKVNLWSVKFVDANHGWAVGRNGTILFTQDGGKNWEQQKSNTKNDLSAISIDKRYCWVVGTGGVILRYPLNRWPTGDR